ARAVTAHEWYGSAPTETASVRFGTRVGLRTSLELSSPGLPPQPQQLTVPFACSAHAFRSRTLTAVMSVSPGTAAGVGRLTRVPLPSAPLELSPQHATVWSTSRAHALASPALT